MGSHIEHPRLIAQRLMNYVRFVGASNVIACTDCGFSTAAGAMNVPTEIVYAKLQSMVKGARIAGEMAAKEAMEKQQEDAESAWSFDEKAPTAWGRQSVSRVRRGA